MNQGEWKNALPYLEQCLPIRRETGDKIGEGITLINIGEIYRAQGNYTKSIEYYAQALAIQQDIGDKVGEAQSRWDIGLTYEDMGDLAKAEEYITKAVQLLVPIDHPALEQCQKSLEQVQAARQGTQEA